MATAAIATISLSVFFIISKYQVVKEIRDVEINYPTHYWGNVLIAHFAEIFSIERSVTAAAPSATPSR